MFNYRSMSDVELLNAYREILVAKRRQILWRAMENHNAAEKKIPNPGADHEKLAVLSSGSSCCTELHDIQIKIAALDAAVIEEEKRLQGMTRARMIPKSCRIFGQDHAVAKAGAKSRLKSKEFHSLALPPSVRAITLRFPPRIYSADRTDPRRMRHDCGVDPDLCGGVRPLRGRRRARSDQALIAARRARSHRLATRARPRRGMKRR